MRIGNSLVRGFVVGVGLALTSSGNTYKSYRVKSEDDIYYGLSNTLSCCVGDQVSLKAYVTKSSLEGNLYFMRRIKEEKLSI